MMVIGGGFNISGGTPVVQSSKPDGVANTWSVSVIGDSAVSSTGTVYAICMTAPD
jgi:hypothetical protein